MNQNDPALVLITSSYPIAGDGSEAAGAFVADLALELSRHRPLRVIAPGAAATVEAAGPGLTVYRFPAPPKPLSTLRPWHPAEALAIWRLLRAGQAATDRAVAAGATASLLALWALPCGQWARRTARRERLPYAVWTLGSDIWSLGRIPIVRGVLREVLRDAAQVWSDGVQLRDDTRAIAGRAVSFLPSTRCITTRRTRPLRSEPPYRLQFLGRWHPNKGIDLLLAALRQLDEDDWQRISNVMIDGGGPLDTLVRAQVAALQASGRPVQAGAFLDRAAAESALANADYLLIPSRIESIPVVFSDAMKLGCPVVTTPVGDLAGLVSGPPACGTVAAAADATAFAAALRQALRRPPQEVAAGVAAMQQRFDLEQVARRLLPVAI